MRFDALAVSGKPAPVQARLERLQRHRENIRRCARELGLDLSANAAASRRRVQANPYSIENSSREGMAVRMGVENGMPSREELESTSSSTVQRGTIAASASHEAPTHAETSVSSSAVVLQATPPKSRSPAATAGEDALAIPQDIFDALRHYEPWPSRVVATSPSRAPEEATSPSKGSKSPGAEVCATPDSGSQELQFGLTRGSSVAAEGRDDDDATRSWSPSAGLPPVPRQDYTFGAIIGRWRQQFDEFQHALTDANQGSRSNGSQHQLYAPLSGSAAEVEAETDPEQWLRRIKRDLGIDSGPWVAGLDADTKELMEVSVTAPPAQQHLPLWRDRTSAQGQTSFSFGGDNDGLGEAPEPSALMNRLQALEAEVRLLRQEAQPLGIHSGSSSPLQPGDDGDYGSRRHFGDHLQHSLALSLLSSSAGSFFGQPEGRLSGLELPMTARSLSPWSLPFEVAAGAHAFGVQGAPFTGDQLDAPHAEPISAAGPFTTAYPLSLQPAPIFGATAASPSTPALKPTHSLLHSAASPSAAAHAPPAAAAVPAAAQVAAVTPSSGIATAALTAEFSAPSVSHVLPPAAAIVPPAPLQPLSGCVATSAVAPSHVVDPVSTTDLASAASGTRGIETHTPGTTTATAAYQRVEGVVPPMLPLSSDGKPALVLQERPVTKTPDHMQTVSRSVAVGTTDDLPWVSADALSSHLMHAAEPSFRAPRPRRPPPGTSSSGPLPPPAPTALRHASVEDSIPASSSSSMPTPKAMIPAQPPVPPAGGYPPSLLPGHPWSNTGRPRPQPWSSLGPAWADSGPTWPPTSEASVPAFGPALPLPHSMLRGPGPGFGGWLGGGVAASGNGPNTDARAVEDEAKLLRAYEVYRQQQLDLLRPLPRA